MAVRPATSPMAAEEPRRLVQQIANQLPTFVALWGPDAGRVLSHQIDCTGERSRQSKDDSGRQGSPKRSDTLHG
jgi:hypothetical protein